MSRKTAGLVLGVALAVVLLGLLGWWLGGRERGAGSRQEAGAAGGRDRVEVEVDLYFPAPGGLLRVERRKLAVTDVPKDRIRKVVEALLAGPGTRGLVRPFPEGVEIGGVQLTDDGTAYVNLRWANHDSPPAAGSGAEMQMVYSLVDSIALNVPQAARVVLLWNGAQRPTFAGHLDTSRPIAPDRSLLAR